VKIAVVGPEATGKSVLAAAIGDALQLPVLGSLREPLLQKSGYHTLFEWVAAGNAWTTLLEKQAAREAAFSDGIVDTGVIDLYCWLQRWGWNSVSPDAFERLRDVVLTRARTYDRIVVTPSRVVAGPQGPRFRSQSYNDQVARLLSAFVEEASLKNAVTRIDDAGSPQRIEQALRLLRG
jgi:nicotinamide riboside kinase